MAWAVSEKSRGRLSIEQDTGSSPVSVSAIFRYNFFMYTGGNVITIVVFFFIS